MDTVTIRKATVDDALAIASVHVRSWQVVYRGHMPDDFLDSLDVESRAKIWRELTQHSDNLIFVAVDIEGNIVGFCALGPSRDSDANPDTAEVMAVYVDPDKWQKGIGRTLFCASLVELRKRDFGQITLWVLEANERARAFYETFGFTLDGVTKDDDRWKTFALREVRYRINVRTMTKGSA